MGSKRSSYGAIGLLVALLAMLCPLKTKGQVPDSIDVIDYDVFLDLSNGKPFAGDATLTIKLLSPCNTLSLGLYGKVDSIWVDGEYQEDAEIGSIPLEDVSTGDTTKVRVKYQGSGHVESSSTYAFGGFHFDNNLHYNLGTSFNENPHSVGRAVYPCRDNFHDKATYTLRIHSRKDWTAECSGLLQERTVLDDGTENSVWRIDKPVSSYIVGVSQAAWSRINYEINSLYGTYPLSLTYYMMDSTRVRNAFADLDTVVPMFEHCLGPYRWDRIGYISTKYGSMEHVHNIALVRDFMHTVSERAQMTIAHELGHSWFGNLVTCSTERDMWINEGGASFCSELAMEASAGKEAANQYYQNALESVIRSTHITDAGYRSLSNMPHKYTYGSTTYDKGEMVWHSLRGYLGDSLFYSSIQKLFDDKAYGSVDAYQVRDLLAEYSGVNLDDFFSFHVFTPGFADFHVEMITPYSEKANARIRIRQQGVGTTVLANGNRVPITFFGNDGEQQREVVSFDGDVTEQDFHLPFTPSYCVLDYELELSDAATLEVMRRGDPLTSKVAHFGLTDSLAEGVKVIVEHHWGRPWNSDSLPYVHRVANRYWVVRGASQESFGVQGKFHFVRADYTASSYPYLDKDFYTQKEMLDSMVVLYREAEGYEWRPVSHQIVGDNREGYFIVDNLMVGEYTLAVVDMANLSIPQHQGQSCVLFPNPLRSGSPLVLDVSTGESFAVRIFDAQGHIVWQQDSCQSGQIVHPQLPAGTYLVRIENKNVSLQSKLIVL